MSSLLLFELKVYFTKQIKALFIPKTSFVMKHWQKMVQSACGYRIHLSKVSLQYLVFSNSCRSSQNSNQSLKSLVKPLLNIFWELKYFKTACLLRLIISYSESNQLKETFSKFQSLLKNLRQD